MYFTKYIVNFTQCERVVNIDRTDWVWTCVDEQCELYVPSIFCETLDLAACSIFIVE